MEAATIQRERDHARQQVERFVRRFEPSYRWLLYYAAMPLVLTPELLNYLWSQVQSQHQVPWVSEVDLLLSDLCRPVGYEQYAIEPGVRAYLLSEMEQAISSRQIQAIARLMLSYVQQMAQTNIYIGQRELEVQQWAAMVYLDDQRESVVKQIAQAYQACAQLGQISQDLARAVQAELDQLERITQELAPQLHDRALLEYADLIRRLLDNPTEVAPAELQRSFVVAEVTLQVPDVLLPEGVEQSSEPTEREQAAISALEEKFQEIQTFVVDRFLESEHEFQLEGMQLRETNIDVDEIQIDSSEAVTIHVLEYSVMSLEEEKASFELSIIVEFSAVVSRFNVDEYVSEIHSDTGVPVEFDIIPDQVVEAKVVVETTFLDQFFSEMEIDDVTLAVNHPILITNHSLASQDSKSRLSAAPTFLIFEFEVATIAFQEPKIRPGLAQLLAARTDNLHELARVAGQDLRSGYANANLTGVDLCSANLVRAKFARTNLTRAMLVNADLTEANLTHANLTQAVLTSANLTSANLTSANLSGADLTNATLISASLQSANLTKACLVNANLRRASLTRANLSGANLFGVDLTDADLRGTNLTNTDLIGAIVTRAQFGSHVPSLSRELSRDLWQRGAIVSL